MAVLNKESIKNRAEWEAMGIELPRYDYEAMRAETQRHPKWVHVGAGNIFRAYIADLAQTLLNDGKMTSGITAVSYTHLDVYKRQKNARYCAKLTGFR